MRAIRLITGYLWAALLGVVGVLLWMHRGDLAAVEPAALRQLLPVMAVLCLSGAQFIFMVLVSDELCPGAAVFFTSVLKTAAGLVVWFQLARAGWIIWGVTAG